MAIREDNGVREVVAMVHNMYQFVLRGIQWKTTVVLHMSESFGRESPITVLCPGDSSPGLFAVLVRSNLREVVAIY